MLIIWGYKTYVTMLGITTMVCGRCQNPAAHRVERLVRKFTLFWIPLFPYRTRTHVTCTFCGLTTEVPKEHVDEVVARLTGAAPQYPPQGGQQYPPQGGQPHPQQQAGQPYPQQGQLPPRH